MINWLALAVILHGATELVHEMTRLVRVLKS